MSAKRKGLGRGLDALMGDDGESRNLQVRMRAAVAAVCAEVPLAQLQAGKGQPRRHFDEVTRIGGFHSRTRHIATGCCAHYLASGR